VKVRVESLSSAPVLSVLVIVNGERLRLRAVSTVETAEGKRRRLANGTTVTVKAVAAGGGLTLADGSTLRNRQVVHGYAMTSHAAQGLTVDKVFVAGAVSVEGAYVSVTRGREGIRVFVPDRERFISAAGLGSEARMSAMEFVRRNALGTDLQSVLARGWRHLQRVRNCFLAIHPLTRVPETPLGMPEEVPVPSPRPTHRPQENHSERRRKQ
jgi:hypothetical protein